MKKIKNFLYNILFTHLGVESKVFNGFIAFLVILSLAIVPFYFFPYFEDLYKTLWVVEIFIVTIFTLELFLKLYVSKEKKKYLFSFAAVIDILVILPFFLIEFNVIENSYFLMSLQVLRIIKLIQMYNSERSNIKHEEITKHGSFKLLKGEVIYNIAHKHYFIFLFSLAPIVIISFFSIASLLVFPSLQTLILSIILAFFAFIKFLKSWIDFHYDALYITSNRLVIQDQHLFGANRTEIPYRAIVQILPNQAGVIRSFFNFGDIAIETAGDSTNSFVQNIPHMEKVLQLVTEQIEKHRNPRKENDITVKKDNSNKKKGNKNEYKNEYKNKNKNEYKKKKNNVYGENSKIKILIPNKNPIFKDDDIKEIQKKNYKNIFSLFSTTKK